jgi:hypothetical protein
VRNEGPDQFDAGVHPYNRTLGPGGSDHGFLAAQGLKGHHYTQTGGQNQDEEEKELFHRSFLMRQKSDAVSANKKNSC